MQEENQRYKSSHLIVNNRNRSHTQVPSQSSEKKSNLERIRKELTLTLENTVALQLNNSSKNLTKVVDNQHERTKNLIE